MKKKQTGIRDIARIMKLSPSTISKALNGAHSIKTQTREAVKEMARQLNYEPNQIAQSLRNNKTFRLGVVVPNLVSHFFSASISGIQDVALENGYNIIICQSNESYQKEVDVVQTLLASQVDGLLMSLSRETYTYDHLHNVVSRGIPLVFFDRVCDEINTSKVIVDDHDGAFKATEHLIEIGCRHIAHISGPEHLSISRERLQGYLDALQKHQISPEDSLIHHTSLLKEDVVEITGKLLDLPNPPDAIFAINDIAATQAMLVIKSRGLRIPEDIALVGFTNIPDAALIEPSLTTVAQPAYQLGSIAGTHILEQITKPDAYTPQTIVLKTELIIRESSGRIAMKA